MTSSPADLFAPLGVVFICATALAAVGQLGPDTFAKKEPSNSPAAAKAGVTGSSAPDAGQALPSRPIAKINWRPQPSAAEPLTRIGFGSCLRQGRPQPIWQAVIAAKPQTFLMMGDNVYANIDEPSGAKLVAAYGKLAADPDFTKARAKVPILAIWDDHDYGQNDGGADFTHKATATRLFQQFWDGSGTLRGNRGPGIAYAQTFGPTGRSTQIIMLDTRSFRSPLKRKPKGAPGKGKYQPDPSADKTMLGDAQWQWLEARLKEPAELRLIVSSIQVIADGHSFERWGNLPKERDKLFALLDTSKARGIVFLSGDRHRAAFYRLERTGRPPIIEATSSALNASFRDPNEKGPNQLAAMFGQNNFGMVTVDWDARVMTLTLRGEDGVAAHALAVPLGGPA